MRNILNFLFLALGLLFLISALALLFGLTSRISYEIFFGIETSKTGYIAYKLIVGALLVFVALLDLRKGKRT